MQGFTGTNCETNIDDCASKNCGTEGGYCVDGVEESFCQCPASKTGPSCSKGNKFVLMHSKVVKGIQRYMHCQTVHIFKDITAVLICYFNLKGKVITVLKLSTLFIGKFKKSHIVIYVRITCTLYPCIIIHEL